MNLRINKILIVAKQSIYDHYVAGRNAPLKALYKRGDPSTARLRQTHVQHHHTLEVIARCLKSSGTSFRVKIGAKKFSPRGFALVIAVGGDGTLLQTAHHILSQPVLGVNSAPVTSVGALCSATARTFPALWNKIIRGRARCVPLQQLEVKLNGRSLRPLVLNDVLFSNRYPAGTSRYLVRIGRRREEQKSSGIWISTASGSTAAILAAGGRRLRRLSRSIQYRVREPYPLEKKRYRLKGGILGKGQTVHIVNKTIEAQLSFDGIQYRKPLKFGDRIEIHAAKIPLVIVE